MKHFTFILHATTNCTCKCVFTGKTPTILLGTRINWINGHEGCSVPFLTISPKGTQKQIIKDSLSIFQNMSCFWVVLKSQMLPCSGLGSWMIVKIMWFHISLFLYWDSVHEFPPYPSTYTVKRLSSVLCASNAKSRYGYRNLNLDIIIFTCHWLPPQKLCTLVSSFSLWKWIHNQINLCTAFGV